MGKPLKQVPKGQIQRRQLSERRRAKAAHKLVTELVTDMVKEEMITPAPADKAVESIAPRIAAAGAPTPAPLGLTADSTDELAGGAQSFGDVLKAIGHAVVVSQAALDDAAIESAKMLSQTKLQVAVAIKQNLDEKGDIPETNGDPSVDYRTLSLSSFILPTLHQWEHVAVSMDLTVGEIDATGGLKVKSGGVSAGVSAGAGGFSAAGEFNYSSLNAESRLRSDFSSGAVRFEALLGRRDEFRFPEIADFAIGPQILVTQTAAAGSAVPADASTTPPTPAQPAFRRVTLTIKVLGKDGGVLTGKSIDLRLPPDLRRRLINPLSGTISLTSTGIALSLAPEFIDDPTQSYRVQIKYGDLVKMIDVVL